MPFGDDNPLTLDPVAGALFDQGQHVAADGLRGEVQGLSQGVHADGPAHIVRRIVVCIGPRQLGVPRQVLHIGVLDSEVGEAPVQIAAVSPAADASPFQHELQGQPVGDPLDGCGGR